MNTDLLLGSLNNLFLGIVFITISIPLLRGKIQRNRWYGVRIPKSYVSEDNWQKINRYGAKAMILWSIPVLVIGLAMLCAAFFVETQQKDFAWILPLSLSGLLIFGALIQTLIWSRKLPGKVDPPS